MTNFTHWRDKTLSDAPACYHPYVQQSWNAALEEAAQLCEKLKEFTADIAAKRIREMKTKE